MKIALGADHGGHPLRKIVLEYLRNEGHEVLDFGTHRGDDPVDYPDFAAAVASAIQQGGAERGILVCGSGVGAAIAANKFRGIRACLCHDSYSAHQGVEHDDMNVLCLGGRVVDVALALELIRMFIAARFTGEERHQRRLKKIAEFEAGWSGCGERRI
jgi:ribose 5-phosphate isomerase B